MTTFSPFCFFQTLLDFGQSPNCRDRGGLTPLYVNILCDPDKRICHRLLYEHSEIGVSNTEGLQEIHQASAFSFVLNRVSLSGFTVFTCACLRWTYFEAVSRRMYYSSIKLDVVLYLISKIWYSLTKQDTLTQNTSPKRGQILKHFVVHALTEISLFNRSYLQNMRTNSLI